MLFLGIDMPYSALEGTDLPSKINEASFNEMNVVWTTNSLTHGLYAKHSRIHTTTSGISPLPPPEKSMYHVYRAQTETTLVAAFQYASEFASES